MVSSADKIKYRAKIISVLNKYFNSKNIDNIVLSEDILILDKIPDKKLLASILFKEILSENKEYVDVVANIAIEIVPIDVFQEYGIKILEDEKIPDNKKFYFISILEHKGIKIDYDNLNFYLQNPIKVANEGIKEFLNDSLLNPESRIDLLDFFKNISDDERLYLIENLSNEYSGDILANALFTILKSEVNNQELDIIIETLLKIDSYYSYKAFCYIEKFYKPASSLKLKLKTFLKNHKLKYENKFDTFLINNSAPYISYIGFVDGNSNFALIFSRKNEDLSITAWFATVNINVGIVSCIGFYQIHEEYFNKIIKRLFTDSLPIKIEHNILKGISDYFCKLNNITGFEVPYEYLVWLELTSDIKFDKEDIVSYISSKLSLTELNKLKFDKISKSKMIENWYFTKNQNVFTDKIISLINLGKISNCEELDDEILNNIDKYFSSDNELKNEIKLRLIFQSYVSLLGGFNVSSSVMYSIAKNSAYLKKLIIYFIYKSIYVYLEGLLDKKNTNVFKKESKVNLTRKQIKELIIEIKNKYN